MAFFYRPILYTVFSVVIVIVIFHLSAASEMNKMKSKFTL